jgi:hypothetical protein
MGNRTRKNVNLTEARLSTLIQGLDELPASTRLSDRRTAADLRQEAVDRLARYDAVHLSKLAHGERIQDRDRHEAATRAFLDEASDLLIGKLGRRSLQLERFGIHPRRDRSALTGAEIVAKTEKARLTREIREAPCSEGECRRKMASHEDGESPPVAAPVNGAEHN